MEKTITIRIDADLHKQIKMHIAEKEISLKDFIVDLIKKDLETGGIKNEKN